jgi:hypothetical protein
MSQDPFDGTNQASSLLQALHHITTPQCNAFHCLQHQQTSTSLDSTFHILGLQRQRAYSSSVVQRLVRVTLRHREQGVRTHRVSEREELLEFIERLVKRKQLARM